MDNYLAECYIFLLSFLKLLGNTASLRQVQRPEDPGVKNFRGLPPRLISKIWLYDPVLGFSEIFVADWTSLGFGDCLCE